MYGITKKQRRIELIDVIKGIIEEDPKILMPTKSTNSVLHIISCCFFVCAIFTIFYKAIIGLSKEPLFTDDLAYILFFALLVAGLIFLFFEYRYWVDFGRLKTEYPNNENQESITVLLSQQKVANGHSISIESSQVLNSIQEKLLTILWKYQRDHSGRKLIILRNGQIYVNDVKNRKGGIDLKGNVVSDLFGVKNREQGDFREFETLMEDFPEVYLKKIPESRMDNPFVVAVTEMGIKYLRESIS